MRDVKPEWLIGLSKVLADSLECIQLLEMNLLLFTGCGSVFPSSTNVAADISSKPSTSRSRLANAVVSAELVAIAEINQRDVDRWDF